MSMTKPGIPTEYGSELENPEFGISAPGERAGIAAAISLAVPVRPAAAAPASLREPSRWKTVPKSIAAGSSALAGRAAWALPFPLAVLALWWVASAFNWVPEQILPPPPLVFGNLRDMLVSGELSTHLAISSGRLFWGFLAGAGIGLPLGLIMGLWTPAREYLFPSFRIVAQVPILAWLPMLMMLVGIDEALKVIIIAKAVAVPIILNTCKGLEGVPTLWIEVAKVYRFNRRQLLKKVVAPAAFPQIWAGVRYGLTHGWLALVVVELLASSEGLGFLIVYGRQLFQLDTVLAAVVVVGTVGWSLDRFLAMTENRILRWRRESFL
jgi:sulfonate transport system permease protein